MVAYIVALVLFYIERWYVFKITVKEETLFKCKLDQKIYRENEETFFAKCDFMQY